MPAHDHRHDHEEAWRHAVADLEEARRQHARELQHEVDTERRRVCFAWLSVVDSLELLLENTDDDDDPSLTIGLRAVRDQAVALLASLGFARDDEISVPFDPQRHEAAEHVDGSGAVPGTVVKVLRPGYRYVRARGDAAARRLRPATVQVASAVRGHQ